MTMIVMMMMMMMMVMLVYYQQVAHSVPDSNGDGNFDENNDNKLSFIINVLTEVNNAVTVDWLITLQCKSNSTE